jgi:hypothetical protein
VLSLGVNSVNSNSGLHRVVREDRILVERDQNMLMLERWKRDLVVNFIDSE